MVRNVEEAILAILGTNKANFIRAAYAPIFNLNLQPSGIK